MTDGWTLALDTATPSTVAAAVAPAGSDGGAGARAARIETPQSDSQPTPRPDHTRRLLALAEDVLAETGGAWSMVTRIVVGLGPGTFTGIRVGVATARAVALANGAEIVGVPTSAALAAAARDGGADGPILVVQDARRREYFLTFVASGDVADQVAALEPWTCPQTDLLAAVEALDPRPTVAVGDGALEWRDGLEALGVAVPEDPAAHRVDGLALVAAAVRATDGDVRPVYVRAPDAIPTAERR